MLRTIPHVASEKVFALKGGTAINLFVRDMPRLSVDIDLTYIPIEPHDVSLKKMDDSIRKISENISKRIPFTKILETSVKGSKRVAKLLVSIPGVQIKIEPNEVIRGVVFPCEERELTEKAQELFGISTSINTVSLPDLYGGKICAALDRQHPRDLFDIKMLLEEEGITDRIRKAFVIYLASHDRPINELIDPRRKDIRQLYEREFVGLTRTEIPYETLIQTREDLIRTMKNDMTNDERLFLLSLKEGNPQWDLIKIKGVENLPALQWKLINIRKMDAKKHTAAIKVLKEKLEM
ncbi:MAG: nucleotidyl transferase AbiEii/AbiGii toxin family protein [Deltaproteobacteria bacterium]|nr:MAG: nucleotidyl transferase AbiEii/AbiGii toxin family protein [Deltaproteobacteria bacterium]